MASIINASTSNGIVQTADTSGNLALQSNGTTVATAQSTGLNLASTGLVFSDSTTQTSGSGVAKAWARFNTSAATIQASYNVSSITQLSTGKWKITFTNAMKDANYTVVGSTVGEPSNYPSYVSSDGGAPTTTYFTGCVWTYTSAYANTTYTSIAVFGN
jgi:hypothetical protein